MSFKTVERDIGFGPKEWLWPAEDEKLFCIFDHVEDVHEYLDLCPNHEVAVQAGGATGVFPLKLSGIFKEVHSFEPQPENFACLEKNCPVSNVRKYHAALSDTYRTVAIHSSIGERKNYGAGYIVDASEGVQTMKIDDLDLKSCGLIMLDIEGAELEALKGGAETIFQHKPLIVIEDKPLPHMSVFNRKVGDPGKWLERFGYHFQGKYRWDSVYSC